MCVGYILVYFIFQVKHLFIHIFHRNMANRWWLYEKTHVFKCFCIICAFVCPRLSCPLYGPGDLTQRLNHDRQGLCDPATTQSSFAFCIGGANTGTDTINGVRVRNWGPFGAIVKSEVQSKRQVKGMFYTILDKELEHLWTSASKWVLEPTSYQYWGMSTLQILQPLLLCPVTFQSVPP